MRSPLRLAGLALLTVCGFLFFFSRLGEPLARLSFDLPFLILRHSPPPDIVLVYLDEESARELKQRPNDVWDRALHVDLLRRLQRDGARLVYYDIVFLTPWPDPAVDDAFAEAIRAHGRVVLGASDDQPLQPSVIGPEGADLQFSKIYPPTEPLRSAAARWGSLSFTWDPDFAVRKLTTAMKENPSASLLAAQLLNPAASIPLAEPESPLWLNYYGPTNTFPSYNFYQAISPDGVPPGYFKDKIVLIGGRPLTSGLALGRDQFANPYSRWVNLFSTGVEVHATELANLLDHTYLRQVALPLQALILLLTGLVVGWAANFLSPHRGIIAMLLFAGFVAGGSLLLRLSHHWFNWLIPVLVQVPLGIVWSTGTQYFYEAKRRSVLRRAFSHYLSPHMADRVAELDFDLTPGGKLVEASVVFTDCQNFTTIAEELNDPLKLSQLLIQYFTATSQCVLSNDGTIIKYIGDAVMAVWGAPVAEEDHAYKAAYAAWQLSEVAQIAVLGRVLKTRVGICTGPMAAGNLGSAFRFDYTVIGDAVNVASRLEELNKLLGTRLLASGATRDRLGSRFIARCVGHFAAAGKQHSLPVYELLCPANAQTDNLEWLPTFDAALGAIHEGRFQEAEAYFRDAIWQRGGQDGPAEFYLRLLRDLAETGELATWTGVVKLREKSTRSILGV